MNSLERTLVLKAGYDHGWEAVVEDTPARVVLASALHRAQLCIAAANEGEKGWIIALPPGALGRELARSEPGLHDGGNHLRAESESTLGRLLTQAARLARTLPDEPCLRFAKVAAEQLAALTGTTAATEIEKLVRQRVGQDIYRESLMDYWGGACAVTGIAIPELLRASHAKPWAKCASDVERLNVFNGFLLTAHLDALFDRHLMTFSDTGNAIFAALIDPTIRSQLGLPAHVRLRWLREEHQPFLRYHREAFESRKGI
jgi:hypothetical protein